MRATLSSMLLAIAAMVSAVGPAHSQSPESLAAADRLLAAQEFDGLMKDMADSMAATLPAEMQQTFLNAMTEPARLERLKASARQTLVKYLTVEELNVTAEFYAQPVARSAMKKMGSYMEELSPIIQNEMAGMINDMQAKK